jgi:superoxide dismutase, Fe-Mn family
MYQAQSFDHLRSLAGMSDGQIAEHLELYAGYVKQVNELTKELADMHNEKKVAGKDFGLAEATRRLAYEYDGMVLHEHYFSNLKPGGAPRPTERQPCGRALAQAYGSIERWQENFKALGGMRGVGWVILFQDPQNGSLTNYWVSLHQDGIPARLPRLGTALLRRRVLHQHRLDDRRAEIQRGADAAIILRRVTAEAGGGSIPSTARPTLASRGCTPRR